MKLNLRKKKLALAVGILAAAGSVSWSYAASAVAGKKMVTYRPAASSAVLHNPYMGLAPDARETEHTEPHKLVYAELTWRDLEPVQGSYQFEKFENTNHFQQWIDQDMKFIIRFVLDDPGKTAHKDIPDWLYEQIGHDGTSYDLSYGKGFSPNYSNEKLIAAHQKVIAKLAQRYGGNPAIAYIELGSLGHWGEWHTKDDSLQHPFPTIDVVDRYVQPYLTGFPDKQLLLRRPYPNPSKDHPMGLYNDVFGSSEGTLKEFVPWFEQGYTFWLTGEQMPAMPDFWMYAASGGEFTSERSLETLLSNSMIDSTLNQAKLSHTTWLGPNVPAGWGSNTNRQKNLDRLLNTMGYRFSVQAESHPASAKRGASIPVNVWLNNEGVAPFYYPWKVELSLANASNEIVASTETPEDIRSWLPGSKKFTQNLSIPAGLPKGTYTLCIGIIDPATGKADVDFAMEGRRSDGRYQLGQIAVN